MLLIIGQQTTHLNFCLLVALCILSEINLGLVVLHQLTTFYIVTEYCIGLKQSVVTQLNGKMPFMCM